MKELLNSIEVWRQYLLNIEVAAASAGSKEERRHWCREMHRTEQLLAALEARLNAVIDSRR
jgi:hypothetical protein